MLQLRKVTKGEMASLFNLLSIEMPESGSYCVLESDVLCLSKAIHVIDLSVKSIFNVGRRT